MRDIAADAKLHKAFLSSEVKVDDPDSRTVRFQITTEGVDRDNDTIAASGWKTADYLKNPVVLFAHDYRQLPVARTLALIPTDKGLSAVVKFPDPGVYPFADTVYDLVKGGFLNATSVGFRPEKWTYNETRGGVDFLEQSLLEFSVVPVPSNPQALVEARAAGIDTAAVKAWAESILLADQTEPGVFLPKAQIERVMKLLAEEERPLKLGTAAQVTLHGTEVVLTDADIEDPIAEKVPEFDGLELADESGDDRLFLAMDDEPADDTIDAEMFKSCFVDTLRAGLTQLMPAIVRSEVDLAIKRARGQAV